MSLHGCNLWIKITEKAANPTEGTCVPWCLCIFWCINKWDWDCIMELCYISSHTIYTATSQHYVPENMHTALFHCGITVNSSLYVIQSMQVSIFSSASVTPGHWMPYCQWSDPEDMCTQLSNIWFITVMDFTRTYRTSHRYRFRLRKLKMYIVVASLKITVKGLRRTM